VSKLEPNDVAPLGGGTKPTSFTIKGEDGQALARLFDRARGDRLGWSNRTKSGALTEMTPRLLGSPSRPFRRLLPQQAKLDDLILCLDEDRACGIAAVESHARLVRFRRHIDPLAVLAAAGASRAD
jgi:hypothetical protein